MRHEPREWVDRDDLGWGVLPNIWIGTSIENSRWTWRADVLREIPAVVRFISAEPLLGSLYDDRAVPEGNPGRGHALRGDALEEGEDTRGRALLDLSRIDWLIVGGESGSRDARPMHPDWARELRDDALSRGIALHFKQWGSYAPRGLVSGLDDVAERHRKSIPGRSSSPREGGRVPWTVYFYGSAPKSAGKLLDGVDYCEFPRAAVPV
jgi:hypothetical protein